MRGTSQPTGPLPSATVVLARDAADGPEVLLVLRHVRASFGASYVFPGGVREPADENAGPWCDGVTAGPGARSGRDGPGHATYSAAVRELFEETGVLLARRREPAGGAGLVTDNAFDSWRPRIHAGSVAWPAFLQRHDLRLACDRLHFFAHWVTPRYFGKRFTTRFFVAAMPPGQDARHDGNELTDSCWLTPRAALAAAGSGALSLPPPTRGTLQDLAVFDTVASMISWARQREAGGVAPILPAVLAGDGEPRIVMPDSADYPDDHRGCSE